MWLAIAGLGVLGCWIAGPVGGGKAGLLDCGLFLGSGLGWDTVHTEGWSK